jgi:hypothetical protein
LVLPKGVGLANKQNGCVKRWMFIQENILILPRYKGVMKKRY